MLARQSLNSISCVLRPKKKEEVPIIICKYRVIFAFPFHKKARRDVELPDCNSIQDFSQYILRQHLIGNVIGSSHSLIETVISSQNLYRQHSIENVSDCFIPFMIARSWLLAPRFHSIYYFHKDTKAVTKSEDEEASAALVVATCEEESRNTAEFHRSGGPS